MLTHRQCMLMMNDQNVIVGVAGVEPALTLHTLKVVYAHAPTYHSVCISQTFESIMDIPIVLI